MKHIFTIVLLIATNLLVGQGNIVGKVVDHDSNESIIFCTIALYHDDKIITGTESDLKGNFIIPNVEFGFYEMEISYVGYQTKKQKIEHRSGLERLKFSLRESDELTCCFGCAVYIYPLIKLDDTSSKTIFNSPEIRRMAY